MSPEAGRRDGRECLWRRRRKVRQALKEHVPPWFIKLGCSTPIRSPKGSKPVNRSVSMGVWDGLSNSQTSEVVREMGKPSLVVRHSNHGEAVGLPSNRVGREEGFVTVHGDATSMEVALSDLKGTGPTEDVDGLRLWFLDLAINEGLHSSMEHAFRFLSLSNKGCSELSVETTASLLEKLERFNRGRLARWQCGPLKGQREGRARRGRGCESL